MVDCRWWKYLHVPVRRICIHICRLRDLDHKGERWLLLRWTWSRPSRHLQEPDTPQDMLHLCRLTRVALYLLLGCPLELQEDLRKSPVAHQVRSICDEILVWVEPYFAASQSITPLVLVLDGDSMKATSPLELLDSIRGLEGCGHRGCSKTIETSQLFQCSRCKTVLYCSKIHQKEDWFDSKRPHKAWCYRTPW
ncbi:hypothetical protein CALVIDRAFT_224203 [Calocera viscosa TUFC12733]|uniref:MYND-type domain-containing protein n=1 Tax=Calocera viscosa (strain TUFC12733) TaxID=1330018 RepID=A0A167K8Q1_CALVF|nr:hypothetical protein CALVIDRAFT_224203 [Calocera viscosa TUFC12733]